MRLYLVYALILVAMAASTRRWIIGVCCVIVLSAVSQHEDMPRSIGGITGLSPINILLGWTLLMFILQRPRLQTVNASLPVPVVALFVLYAGTIVVSYLQGVIDLDSIRGPTAATEIASLKGFTVEFLINPFKTMLPAVLLYLGVRTKKDLWLVLAALGLMSLLLAFVVLRNLPLGTLLDHAAYMARRHRIQNQTGLHANDLALIVVQGCWAAALFLRLRRPVAFKAATVALMCVLLLAVALCHSRAGFLAFVATGLVIGVATWRKLLIGLPLLMVGVAAAFPTIPERILTGFGVADVSGQATQNWESISAGRTNMLWPHALAQISESPTIGAGRLAILRTDMFGRIEESSGEMCPSHPHNAYLEILCDGGVVSLIILLTGLLGLPALAFSLCMRKNSEIDVLIGGLGLVALVPLMAMGMTGQSFWPRENLLPSACLIALMLRRWTLLLAARRSSLVTVTPTRARSTPRQRARAPEYTSAGASGR